MEVLAKALWSIYESRDDFVDRSGDTLICKHKEALYVAIFNESSTNITANMVIIKSDYQVHVIEKSIEKEGPSILALLKFLTTLVEEIQSFTDTK
jgi:hypothetical protein